MFDFSWSEIALIGGVALVLIGPKDMPVAMRTVAGFVKKARGMASEFQGHVDEMLREADLSEARDTFRQMRGMNVRGRVMSLLDDDGSLRRSVREATAPLPPLHHSSPAIALPAGTGDDGADPLPVVGSTADHGASTYATASSFSSGPFVAPGPALGDAPAPIPPRAAREILRRATPRPDFLPPDPGRHIY